MSPARRRYLRRMLPLMAIYLVLILGAAWLIRHEPPPGAWRYLLAALPAAPLIAVMVSFGVYLTEITDEFRRMVVVYSMLWAIALVLAFSTVWGFLEMLAGAPHLELWWIFPIYAVAQSAAQPLIARRYR